MRTLTAFVRIAFTAFAFLIGRAVAQTPAAEVQTAAPWRSIDYPMVEIPSAPGEKCWLLVRSGVGAGLPDQKPRLRVTAGWSGQQDEPQPEALTKPERMNVRLHRAKGGTVEPLNAFVAGPTIGMTGGQSVNRTAEFSWGENTLEEAWFELRIDDRVYWLEVPYGFVRDPMAPLAPAISAGGPGGPAPVMKELGAAHRVVPWTKIDYDLGEIQNGCRLSAAALNGEGARWFTT